MSNIWLLLLSRVRIRRPRWFVPLVLMIVVGVIVAGFIYATAVFKALEERSYPSHVHTHSAH
jgi:uncharacterized membrane protein (UPF0136 family)